MNPTLLPLAVLVALGTVAVAVMEISLARPRSPWTLFIMILTVFLVSAGMAELVAQTISGPQ